MKKVSKLAVIGLGGVGGYFGFKLAEKYAQEKGIEVSFVARDSTYQVVKSSGLTLLSPEHEDSVVHPGMLYTEISDLPVQDLILICVKEYDLENVCLQLKDKINEDTVLLPLMNGVDIYERIRKIIDKGVVMPACVYVASHIKEKGIVEHKGKPGKIIAGQDPAHPDTNLQEIVHLVQNAGIDISYQVDVFPAIWTKFFFIASFGLVTARYNKTIGQVNEDPQLHEKASRIMKELKAIASKKAIAIPESIISDTFQKAASFPYQTPTSLQLDVQSGKSNTELELFAGAILYYGRQLNIPVPETEKIHTEIKSGMRS